MKQDKDWIDVMRSSLREADPIPPAGGWERLEGQLGRVVPPRSSVWRIYWPRIAAAAALLLFFVAGGEFLLRTDRNVHEDGAVIVPLADGGGKTVDLLQPAKPDAGLEKQVAAVYHREIVRQNRRGALVAQAADLSAKTPVAEIREPEAVASVPTAAGSDTPAERKESSRKSEQAVHTTNTQSNNLFGDSELVEKPRRGRISAGLFAGGSMAGGTEKGRLNRVFADMMTSGGDAVVSQRFTYNDFSYRHHLPLSVGLTLRKELPYGLSLESGVNYTLLRSDVQAMNNSKSFTQSLHFVGVPLRLNWQFLERGGFSLYMGAGGMFEKCVGAKFGSKSVDVPGLQWSVTGAVGAQYKLGGVVGLYFEPEVSYYFTQTDLRTSRTDSPLSVALRLGVRFTF